MHRVNTQTYLFKIDKDKPESYNARLSINLIYLTTGTYTMVFEMIFAVQIDPNKVNVNAVSGSLNQISTHTRIINFDHGHYSRSIINFHKWIINNQVDDLDIDINLPLKDNIQNIPSYTQINVIVYGTRGTHSDINTELWDRLYYVDNGNITYEVPIDMNKHDIKNVDNLSMNKLIDMNMGQIKYLGDGNENGDAVNVKQLNNVESNMGKYIKAEITKVDTSLKKYFNDHLNNAIVERGYQNSLICVFYLDNNQFNNGDKIANLPDKKSFMPIHDANQSVESRKPTADDDLNFSYMNYKAQQCLTVD